MHPTDIYTFKVHHPPSRYEVEITISGHISLHGLAEHIIDAIGFDFDHAFGFYDNLKNPYEAHERYTLFADMGETDEELGGSDPGVLSVLISELFEPEMKMLFSFDYGDDWQFPLHCTQVTSAKNKRKVREIGPEKGRAPIQYHDDQEK